MKKLKVLLCLFLLTITVMGCGNDDMESKNDENIHDIELVGQDGNPRFNLQFNNEEGVDLDLYVKTPNGSTLFYLNGGGEGGELDVDCQCIRCPQGAHENIFWENGTASNGTYEYWVEYYGNCGSNGASSDFTLRVIKNDEILATKTGTLSEGRSNIYKHNQS